MARLQGDIPPDPPTPPSCSSSPGYFVLQSRWEDTSAPGPAAPLGDPCPFVLTSAKICCSRCLCPRLYPLPPPRGPLSSCRGILKPDRSFWNVRLSLAYPSLSGQVPGVTWDEPELLGSAPSPSSLSSLIPRAPHSLLLPDPPPTPDTSSSLLAPKPPSGHPDGGSALPPHFRECAPHRHSLFLYRPPPSHCRPGAWGLPTSGSN